MNIRRASISDNENVCSCNKACLPICYSSIEYIFMLMSGYIILIAEKDKKLLGYIISNFENDSLHIYSFAIYPEHRRMGIGSMLINKNIETAKKNNCKKISLNVHTENITGLKFYKKLGFKKNKTLINYYNNRIPNTDNQDAYSLERYVDWKDM